MVAKTAPYPPWVGFRVHCPEKHRGLCATLRRLTPTKHTAGPLGGIAGAAFEMDDYLFLVHSHAIFTE